MLRLRITSAFENSEVIESVACLSTLQLAITESASSRLIAVVVMGQRSLAWAAIEAADARSAATIICFI